MRRALLVVALAGLGSSAIAQPVVPSPASDSPTGSPSESESESESSSDSATRADSDSVSDSDSGSAATTDSVASAESDAASDAPSTLVPDATAPSEPRASFGAAPDGFGLRFGELSLRPVVVAEIHYVQTASSLQGEPGFGLRRARVGFNFAYGRTLAARLVFQAETERPGVLDAFVAWRPHPTIELAAGYRRNLLFATGRDELEPNLTMLERSVTVRSFWPSRDLGVEARTLAGALPFELFARVGNGSESPLADSDDGLAFSTRADLVLGRERGERDTFFGLRLGLGHVRERTRDRVGVGGTLPTTGFRFQRGVTVSGVRHLVGAHGVIELGPLRATVEGGFAREGRKRDHDGDPNTPRMALDSVESWGVSSELTYVLRGHATAVGQLPLAADERHFVEVAARYERVRYGLATTDVTNGGAHVVGLGLRWWPTWWLAIGAAGHTFFYDVPPIDDPARDRGYVVLARASLMIDRAPRGAADLVGGG